MDTTPERPSRPEAAVFSIASDPISSPRRSNRIKKPPPITPRRFTRFFTPRQGNGNGPGPRPARGLRKALRDVPKTSLNIRQNESTPPPRKKRKLSFLQSPTSSLPSSPVRKVGFLASSQEQPVDDDDDQAVIVEDEIDSEASTDIDEKLDDGRGKIKSYRMMGTSASLLSGRLGGRPSRVRTAGKDLYLHETANFYSSATDLNVDNGPAPGVAYRRNLSLPFCTTSCHTNSLVAVGDEEGTIRLIDSANEHADKFNQSFLKLKPHDNAIMDLEFSENDSFLATASGDQTCHVIDVRSQKSMWALTGHSSSVKKVQFQPGSRLTLATCARDGAILIWDVRENPTARPAHTVRGRNTSDITGVLPKHAIQDAHLGRLRSTPRAHSGRNDFSVTSLSFIDPSRPHLFATASESDSVVKLWDMRSTHRYRRKTIPVSCTNEPKSHEIHRRFGITSLAMSTDHSRLYTLCRDHTVYAYSASHLILGSAPELSHTSKPFDAKHHHADISDGLGPIHGFRHPALQVSTFYPKLAVRKATASTSELIAVGSTDDCAVLFPTEPRYLTSSAREIPPPRRPDARPRLTRMDSQSASLSFIHRRSADTEGAGEIPMYYHGTPLIKGHSKEVTAVTFTSEGNLVSISDDFGTRCWREDKSKAARLRGAREGQGDGAMERWGCGWADIGGGSESGKGWDEEDC